MMTPFRKIALGVFAGVLLMAVAGYLSWPRFVEHKVDYKMSGNPQPKIVAAQAAAIERRERVVDQTIWRKEMEAQEYGRFIEDFWDALNAATNKWDVVERLTFQEMVLGAWQEKESLGHGIENWLPGKTSEYTIDSYAKWREKLSNWKEAGWAIMQCEFRHIGFDPQTNDLPAKSKFYFSVHLTNGLPAQATVEGDLLVKWAARKTNEANNVHEAPSMRQIDASGLQVMFRAGPPAFVPVLTETFDPPPLSPAIEPLLVYDLDSDGIPEIALPAANRVYRWKGDHYESETFCPTPRMQVWDGLFADMDGDGVVDFLYVESDGVFLLKGSPGGHFETPPRALTGRKEDFFGARAITCGDIDSDGDLDVFVGQYKGPYTGGSMPTPYYEANDGYPSHLYINDGAGNLRDATVEAGLGPKQFRRVYSASFVDLNADGALDLVVTSDFAGVDIYRNDGLGHFTDVTSSWLDESHLFGMGHAFGDFNNDGRLDFYLAGMQSPTAERLEHLGLNRPGSELDARMRAPMIFGSRLYLGENDRHFQEDRTSKTVARTGWSWGASAADFDNDGWLDLYVVNGMESMGKVRDYDRQFWLHDIYVGDSRQRDVENLYFGMKMTARRQASESYGGFEKNRLLLNQDGTHFASVAHLLGVALEADCRNLVAADLDGDGRIDLALTSQHALPETKEKLRVLRNEIAEQGNWIAFSFREEPNRISPIGATVSLRGTGLKKVAAVVTGDSFRSQHPLTAHFGLGNADRVEAVEIRWPGGAVTHLAGPKINQAHRISAPKR
ncbi:MAG TPA: CRTAC1 family protein [Verrucomicrobiae bacterium]|nr:CRTAC1 family protein [Verrucomicrobiae bacterium]